MEDPRVVRAQITERTTSFVIAVGEPYRPGGAGRIGDVWGGLLIRSSNTGFAALAIQLHLTRLVCLNGMTVPHEEAVLRRVHRGFQLDDLESALYSRLRELPERLHMGIDRLAALTHVSIGDVEEEVHRFLALARLPRRLGPAMQAAYKTEEHASAFGIVQAITLSAEGTLRPRTCRGGVRSSFRVLADNGAPAPFLASSFGRHRRACDTCCRSELRGLPLDDLFP